MKRGYADIPEGQIHYRTEGSGAPVLLLHQGPLSSESYTEVMHVLSRHYRTIAMDTLGYGLSDKPARTLEIEDYGRSVVNFLDALNIPRASIVGHHTGATVAGEVAAVYPDRVDKLVLSGASLYTPEERKAFLSDPIFGQPMRITEDGTFLVELWQHLRGYFSSTKVVKYPVEKNQVWAYETRPLLSTETTYRIVLDALLAGAGYTAGSMASFRYNKEQKLPLIKSPTLIMCGDRDMLFNKLEAVQKLIPRCKTKVYSGIGDAVIYTQPEEFARSILDFLRNPDV